MDQRCIGNPFCSSLSDETRELLCKNVTVSFQLPKQIQTNQWGNQLEIIAEGVLLKYTLLEDGTQKGIEIIRNGGLLGEHKLFSKLDYPDYHTMALTKVKKCHYPIDIIEKLFNENKDFAKVLTFSLSKHLAANHRFWVEMHSRNGIEKVEYVFRMLEELEVDMNNITQEDLALIAGVSRITVAKAMKQIYN